MALAQKKAVSWQAATATRERVIRLLENLEEGRRYVVHDCRVNSSLHPLSRSRVELPLS